MKILVLNGSPKGEVSVTMQYVKYIQKIFPEHELQIENISLNIKKIEKDEKEFKKIIDEVKNSDGILWAFPLYVFIVASQYKRFIELISERGAKEAFRDKYTSVITTSIHFYDHTAHNYMNAVCDDLNMKYTGFFSADMKDLFKEEGRNKLELFAKNFFRAIENKIPVIKNYNPLSDIKLKYMPEQAKEKIEQKDKKIVLLTDTLDEATNLGKMISKFKNSFSQEIEIYELDKLDIKGGCLGCIKCGFDNECAYKGKDDLINFYNNKLKTADIIVFAGTIKDRYLSSKWKQFFDRGFFNTHMPSFMGKQIGYIISGPLREISNLREIFQAYTEWQKANLVDFVTDEYETSPELDKILEAFAERIVRFSLENYIKGSTFLGIGGMKIFRDDIWGRMRFVFQADHKFYKKHGIYDFPHNDLKTRLMNMFIPLTWIPPVKKAIRDNMKKNMLHGFEKIVS